MEGRRRGKEGRRGRRNREKGKEEIDGVKKGRKQRREEGKNFRKKERNEMSKKGKVGWKEQGEERKKVKEERRITRWKEQRREGKGRFWKRNCNWWWTGVTFYLDKVRAPCPQLALETGKFVTPGGTCPSLSLSL